MMIGNFFSMSNVVLPSVISGILYVTGIALLTTTSKNTF